MKTRIIQTKFWEDDFVGNLSVPARLVFIYLLTNSTIGLTGAYECPDKKIVFYTGVSPQELKEAKRELDSRIIFKDGWVAIKKALKYNNYAEGNEIQKKAYEKEKSSLPEFFKNQLVGNYSLTSPRLDRIQNTEIRIQNTENTGEGLGGDPSDFFEAEVIVPEGYEKPPEVPPPSPEIAEGLALFKPVNPGYKKFYKDLAEHEALQELYDERGRDEVQQIIKILPKSNEVKFIPKAYKPTELRDKYQKIISQIKIHLEEKEKIKSRVAF